MTSDALEGARCLCGATGSPVGFLCGACGEAWFSPGGMDAARKAGFTVLTPEKREALEVALDGLGEMDPRDVRADAAHATLRAMLAERSANE